MVETQGEKAGTKWDDLVIKFEWLFQIDEILANPDYAQSEQLFGVLERAAKDLKYAFNDKMV